jgi:hypothetical protein
MHHVINRESRCGESQNQGISPTTVCWLNRRGVETEHEANHGGT